jgi:cysteine-rich repeat protein
MNQLLRHASPVVVLGLLAANVLTPPAAQAASLNLVQALDDSLPYGSLAVSPDGEHVYATGNGFMFIFDRDTASGTLTLQQPLSGFAELGGGLGTVGAAVSSDGEHVYVLSPGDDLLVFDRNSTTGALSLIAVYDSLADSPGLERQPTGLALSADGSSVYVVANDPLGEQSCGAVSVFDRDASDGTLAKIETEVLTAGACPGGGAVTVSADGANVYVTGDNAVQVYTRSLGDGSLSPQQVTAPAILRDSGSDIAAAPDGSNVYVASNVRGTVFCDPTCITEASDAFARDLFGSLTGLASTDERELRKVAVDAAGAHVLFASRNGRVLLFDRSMPSGLLTPSDVFEAAPADVGFGPPLALVLSADGRHAYVNFDRKIVVLQLTCGDGVVDSGEGCDDGDTSDGNGCSKQCQVEPCWSCAGAPSSCATVSNGTACDDGSLCTIADVCTAGTCTGSAEPEPTCHTPARSKIAMKLGSSTTTKWKWLRGSTLLEDFGDPVTTTDYTLCIYDTSARPQPIAELVPPRFCSNSGGQSCWRTNDDEGFEYSDRSRYPFHSISLRAGGGGKARVTVNAGSVGEPLDASSTLPLTTPVTVQLKTSEGECWQSSHSAAKANTESKFSAR